MWNAKLDEAHAGIKFAGRNITNLRYADDNNPNGRKPRGTKEESEKVSLKLNAQKTKIMASSPMDVTSWQINGETMETVTEFILGGSKITADAECCHEIKRCLLLVRKDMTKKKKKKKSYDQPKQHIKKQRHYLANKSWYSQSYGFSSSHYGCESWTIKQAEGRRIDAFKLWCWRRLLRVPWSSNQQGVQTSQP